MANWIKVWDGQRYWLLDFDKMETVVETKDGFAQIEWGKGDMQITSKTPNFHNLGNIIIKEDAK